MPLHPPIEFRYFKIAEGFPAKPALEYVLTHFINAKRDAMAEASVSEAVFESSLVMIEELDGKEATHGTYPDYDVWMRFAFSHYDYLARATDRSAAGEVPRFEIEQAEAAEHGIVGEGEDDDGTDDDAAEPERGEEGDWWVFVRSYLALHYSGAALALRFTQGPLGGPVYCTCWICYAEGDGADLGAAARGLGYR